MVDLFQCLLNLLAKPGGVRVLELLVMQAEPPAARGIFAAPATVGAARASRKRGYLFLALPGKIHTVRRCHLLHNSP